MNRRQFAFASCAVAATVRGWSQQATGSAKASLVLHENDVLAHVPENFVGLSYEVQELTDPAYFSAANTAMVQAFKTLTPNGVLRLGGNTSDVGWWKDSPTTVAPEVHFRDAGEGEPGRNQMYFIEPVAVTNLRGFLDATGWTCLFGINLGSNTPERGAIEAEFVAKALGPKLEYFQLGNEPDLFSRHLRDPKTWTADAYFDEWLKMANAIRARVPHAKFGLPDTAGNPEWYATVVTRLLALKQSCAEFCDRQGACGCAESAHDVSTRPWVAGLSHHYYFSGPPSNPNVNIERLLKHDAKVDSLADAIRAAAARLSPEHQKPMPYRMSEGNTCFRGGKPGVSDVFAATLWAADYGLTLAAAGYCGVNLHGGSSMMVANSLGGTLPGDAIVPTLAHGANDWHPRPYYTPIAAKDGAFAIQPVGIGLELVQKFAGGRMVRVAFDPAGANAVAYAAILPDGTRRIAVINKDASKTVTVGLGARHAVAVQGLLEAPLDSQKVEWQELPDTAHDRKQAEAVTVKAGSAVVFDIQ